MATRFGTRVLGLKRWFNAKYYFSNISLYLNGDHFAELQKYLGHIYEKVNLGQRTAPSGTDEVGNAQFSSSLHTSEVRCGACPDDLPELEWTEGGDAAAGNSISNLEAPPSKQGCCYYCENRRAQWFDATECAAAKRRTLFRTSLLAHMLPPGAPPGASYRCVAKDCTFTITAASSAAAIAEASLLTESQLGMAELAHRKSHTGVLPGRVKLSHCDHIKRQMSLLHFNLKVELVRIDHCCGFCSRRQQEREGSHELNVRRLQKSLPLPHVRQGAREEGAGECGAPSAMDSMLDACAS